MLTRAFAEKAIKTLLAELWDVRSEKTSVSHFLHEELLQSLIALRFFFSDSTFHEGVSKKNDRLVLEMLDDSINKIKKAYDSILIPPFNMLGLRQIIEAWIIKQSKEKGVNIVIVAYPEELDKQKECMQLLVYRILTEVISNVINHAHATRAEIRIKFNSNDLLIEVKDNGVGFDGKESSWKSGLIKCFLCIYQVNGSMNIISEPGKGCIFIATVPHNIKAPQIMASYP